MNRWEKMKIAQVCPRYKPHIGGVETVVEEISRRLAAQGHDVSVITTDPARSLPGEETIDGVKVYRFPARAPGDAYYFSLPLRQFLESSPMTSCTPTAITRSRRCSPSRGSDATVHVQPRTITARATRRSGTRC